MDENLKQMLFGNEQDVHLTDEDAELIIDRILDKLIASTPEQTTKYFSRYFVQWGEFAARKLMKLLDAEPQDKQAIWQVAAFLQRLAVLDTVLTTAADLQSVRNMMDEGTMGKLHTIALLEAFMTEFRKSKDK